MKTNVVAKFMFKNHFRKIDGYVINFTNSIDKQFNTINIKKCNISHQLKKNKLIEKHNYITYEKNILQNIHKKKTLNLILEKMKKMNEIEMEYYEQCITTYNYSSEDNIQYDDDSIISDNIEHIDPKFDDKFIKLRNEIYYLRHNEKLPDRIVNLDRKLCELYTKIISIENYDINNK
jgi:hypothetical protein